MQLFGEARGWELGWLAHRRDRWERNGCVVNNAGSYQYRSDGYSVNTNTRVVSQSTTSFSEWGVYGDSSAAGMATKVGAAGLALLSTAALLLMFVF